MSYNNNLDFRKKSFGSMVENYQKFRRPYASKIYETLFSLLPVENQKIKILDIGCGSGKSTEPLCSFSKKINIEIIGCDHDERMLEAAKESAEKGSLDIKYIYGRAEQLPFEDREFDAVVSGTAFHWFANEEALNEIKRVLKPNGLFFIFWRNPTMILDKNGEHVAKSVYSKFNCKAILGEWRNVDVVKEIFLKGGFKDFHTVKFLTEQIDTISDLIGGHKTNSKYAALLPEERDHYIDELTKEYQKALADKPFFKSERENIICYGRSY